MSARRVAEDLEAKVDSDLAHRTLQGSFFNPATLALVFFTTTVASDYPVQFWIFAAVFVAINASRIPLLLNKDRSAAGNADRWRTQVMLTVFATGFLWGILGGFTSAVYGCDSRNATLLILYISAIAGAGVHVLIQSVRLVAIYLCGIIAPTAILAAFQGRQGFWLSIAIVFYFFYLINQTRRLHGQYWQQLRDNRELSIRAHQDSLTGLPNRFAAREGLSAAITLARSTGRTIPLLYIDLDGFKQVNDNFSHRVGDLFLREIADRLKSSCYAIGLPARLGGDEFSVLLQEGTSAEETGAIAGRLLKKLQEPMILDGHRLAASASIGASVFPEDCHDEEGLLRTADQALYCAKAAGKGTYRMFRDSRRSPRFQSNDLARDIREAMEKDQFEVHYQPQVNAAGELAGFEALIRWTHPVSGNIPPLEFIPLAEETGLMVPLGFWIMRRVCEQGRAWYLEGYPPVPIAVNVSPVQLDNAEFIENVLRILQETGFPPSQLTLEITESTLLSKHGDALSKLRDLRERGIKIAIDDFGTGYSSLSRIHVLPIDELKIDRTFISNIQKTGDRAPIVEAVLAMARSLNLNVVVEGIEVPEQYEVLTRMGCEVFQGYYFGKAATADRAHRYRIPPRAERSRMAVPLLGPVAAR